MKNLLPFNLLVAFGLLLSSCAQPTEWNAEQRAEFISALDNYRTMVYLNELDNSEFILFTEQVTDDVETSYPVYTQFITLPSLSDTVDMWVVTTIVSQIETDAANMRYLYPYQGLVAQGVLPAGLDDKAQKSFYHCLSQKVNKHFTSLDEFFYAVITNSIDHNQIARYQRECADGLFVTPEVLDPINL